MKVRDIMKQLEDDGWSVVRQRGSHRQFKHATKPGLVTVAGKPGDDVGPGTLPVPEPSTSSSYVDIPA